MHYFPGYSQIDLLVCQKLPLDSQLTMIFFFDSSTFKGLSRHLYDNMRFQWEIPTILPILPRSPNFSHINILVFLIVFAEYENIGKKPKFSILLCTVQKL